MRQRYAGLGSVGLNTDVQPSGLPDAAWTSLVNVVCEDGALRSMYGELKRYALPIRPLYHVTHRQLDGSWWIVTSDGLQVWMTPMEGVGNHINITPEDGDWAGGYVSFAILNSRLVVNSASNGAFYLVAENLILLPDWDPTWLCREMVAYRYYLVALGFTEGEDYYPHKVCWSSSAEDGAVPAEWYPSLENDAGDELLGETPGHIIGGALVRDALFIVKEDATYALNWVGGQFVMQSNRLNGSTGTSLQKGYVEMRGEFVTCTTRDLMIFNGQSAESLATGRVRTALQNVISDANWDETKLFRHNASTTLWVGGSSDSTRLQSALIFNWTTNTWFIKSLNYCYGFIALPTADGEKPLTEIGIIESNAADTNWWVSVLAMAETNSDGTNKICTAERIGMPFEGADGLAMIREAWLDADGTQPLTVTFGSQDRPDGPVTWAPPETWTQGVSRSMTPRLTGRFMAVRLQSQGPGWWRVGAITIDLARQGER